MRASSMTLVFAVTVAIGALGCDDKNGGNTSDAGANPDSIQPHDSGARDAEFADAEASDASPDAMPSAMVFTPVSDFAPPEGAAETRQLVIFKTAAEFSTYFGIAPPIAIDFASQWALFYTEGLQPVPGHVASVAAMAKSADDGLIFVETLHRSPGTGCELLSFSKPASALVTFTALTSAATGLIETAGTTTHSCAASGQPAGDNCSPSMLCEAGLICAGLTVFEQGFCAPASFHGIFSEELETEILSGTSIQRQMTLTGLSTVALDVILYVEVDHADPSDLLITLTNPATSEVVAWNNETVPGGLFSFHRVTPFSTDESANGSWTLSITNSAGGNRGTLKRWSLEIVSWPD